MTSCNNNLQAKIDSNHNLHKFRITSYNILLPNGTTTEDDPAWWIFKYYSNETPMSFRSWTHRKGLIEKILVSNTLSDIICVQEALADSFESDFEFIPKQNYHRILHRKYRYRPAIFYNSDMFECLKEIHGDRTLSILLLHKESMHLLAVVNVHLTGGADGVTRLRQVSDALTQVRKAQLKLRKERKAEYDATQTKKAKFQRKRRAELEKMAEESREMEMHRQNVERSMSFRDTDDAQSNARMAVVVCGDFNASGHTGVRELLLNEKIDASFLEGDVSVTAKEKIQPFGPFQDVFGDLNSNDIPLRHRNKAPHASEAVENTQLSSTVIDNDQIGNITTEFQEVKQVWRQPTYLVEDVFTQYVNSKTGEPSELFKQNVLKVFDTFCSVVCVRSSEKDEEKQRIMTRSDVKKWLEVVNHGKCDRGVMYRSSERILCEKEALLRGHERGVDATESVVGICEEELIRIYWQEIVEGRLWAVRHDFRELKVDEHVHIGIHSEVLDYMYISSRSLKLNAIVPSLTQKEFQKLERNSEFFPNEFQPSDHLPITAEISIMTQADHADLL